MKKEKSKKYDVFQIIKNNYFVLKLSFKHAKLMTLFVCLESAIHGVIIFFEHTYSMKIILDCIQYNNPFTCVLNYMIPLFITVLAWTCLSNYVYAFIIPKQYAKLEREIRMILFEKAVTMDLERYDNPEYYNDLIWSMKDGNMRINAVARNIGEFLGALVLPIVYGVFMISYDKVGFVLVMGTTVFTIIFTGIVNKLKFKLSVELNPKQRRQDYISRVFYKPEYAKELRLSDIKEKLFKDFNITNYEIQKSIKKYSTRLFIYKIFTEYLFSSFIIETLYVVYMLHKTVVMKLMGYGTMVTLLRSAWELRKNIQSLSATVPQFQNNSLYIDKLCVFLDYKPKITDCVNALPLPQEQSTLKVQNLDFAYVGNNLVLKNINMEIKPQQKVAVVGYNGSGKTTLIKLLMRLYDSSSGSVEYNGVNVKKYYLMKYRDIFGAVFQDHQLFSGTLAENVVMSDAEFNEERVREALIKSGFGDKLLLLNNDINTYVNKEFHEDGIEFSGGEAQKIAISRVLYKDCKIIVLDEPSSAFDPMSERHLNETIINKEKNKAIIFISHRLSTTKMADIIYMLKEGQIIEIGSHAELMNMGGEYAKMFNLQAEKYKHAIINGGIS